MSNLIGDSNDPGVAAVFGEHTAGQAAIIGKSNDGRGVLGVSEAGQGVWGHSVTSTGVVGVSTSGWGTSGESQASAGVVGISTEFNAVRGISHASGHGAVVGINDNAGDAAGPGVYGESRGTGVWGQSATWMGVFGHSDSLTGGAGVMGDAIGPGVIGVSKTWHGVYGETPSDTGGAGVWGQHKGNGSGVVGMSEHGVGVLGRGGRVAGRFEGDVEVTGDIRLENADCAEDFDISGTEQIDPGTVMILGQEGVLFQSQKAYDKRVAGIISGAGDYKPGIILDKHESRSPRKPIALIGKVYCKVDASYGPIEVGDMLTTSDTSGHAMKVVDPTKAFGAVIGKALRPLENGRGLIPVLIALQ